MEEASGSASDPRPPQRLTPLANTTSTKKKRRRNPNKSSSKSASAENFSESPPQQRDHRVQHGEPSGKGLLTANMLEKLKERLQSEDIKPLVTSDSSSYSNTIKTTSTSMPRTETTGTEVLSIGSVSGRGRTGEAGGESGMAWHEPEPVAMTADEDDPRPFNSHPDSQDSSPRSPTMESRDLQHPTISQTTYVKHRSDPAVTTSSKQTDLTSSHRHQSMAPVLTTEHEQLRNSQELTESHIQLPKFYRGPDETDNPLSPPGRSLPDLPADTDIMEMRERASDQVVPMEHVSEPQNPWQMLTGTDVVEKMEPGSELRDLRAPPTIAIGDGYLHPPQHRRRSVDANIFTERRDGRGFMRKTNNMDRSYGNRIYASVSAEITGTQYALFLHSFTQHLSVAVHGLIAGLSIWHSVIVNYIGRSFSHLNVLQYFHYFALPLHTVHYFCLAIVLLSILDRLDLGNISLFYVKSFLKNPSQFLLLIVAALVLVSLIITAFLGAHEEQMALFASRPSLWSDLLTAVNKTSAVGINALTPSTLQYPSHLDANVVYIPARSPANSTVVNEYMGLVLARAVCCLVSWVAVLFTGDYDRLKDQVVGDSPPRSRRVSKTSFQLPATTVNYVGR